MNTKKENDIFCSNSKNHASVGETTESRFEKKFDANRTECPWEKETTDALNSLKRMLETATPIVWVGR